MPDPATFVVPANAAQESPPAIAGASNNICKIRQRNIVITVITLC
jgi:hypothetical protein